MAAHQAPPSLGFSRQEHWSGLPFPSPMHASEKWKWSPSVMSDSSRPHGLQPTGLLRHGIFQTRVLEWGAIAFSCLDTEHLLTFLKYQESLSSTEIASSTSSTSSQMLLLLITVLALPQVTACLIDLTCSSSFNQKFSLSTYNSVSKKKKSNQKMGRRSK